MQMNRFLLLLPFLLIGGALGGPTMAQDSPDSVQAVEASRFPFRTTLDGWAADRRRYILDRTHSVGGRLYDRGLFRDITPRTPRDYAYEMLAHRFRSQDINAQRRAENSLLLRTGSVRRDLFAFYTQLQSRIPLAEEHDLSVDAVLQEDGRAQRVFMELGYTWQLASRHALRVRQTFSQSKRDLDLTAAYRYTHARLGEAEVGVTFLDLYSDLIDQRLGIDADDREVIRDYSHSPYLLSLSYTSPEQYPLRGELIGMIQPKTPATFSSQKRPEYRYRDTRRVHVLGALLEYRYAFGAGGVFYKRESSWLRRLGTGADVSSDYTARQRSQRVGAFVKGRYGPLRGVVRGTVGSYLDHQDGTDYSQSLLPKQLSYDEGQQSLRARVLYQPDTGFFTGVEYLTFRRSYDGESDPSKVGANFVFAPWTKQYWGFGPSNYGLLGLVGYRFERGKVVVGAGFDLDGDDDYPADHAEKERTRRFDGGFTRLVLTW